MTALWIAWLAWADAVVSTMVWACIRAMRRTPPHATPRQRVLLIRPCSGDASHLTRALASTRVLDRERVVVRFAVCTPDDPCAARAIAVSDELARDGFDARVVWTNARAFNLKAAQLAVVARGTTTPIVAVADDDVELDRKSFDALCETLGDPRIAAAWAPFVETCATTFGDHISSAVLDSSLHAFPILASLDPHGMVGKLFAVRSDALARVGGFEDLDDHLGEDAELARRLRRVGLRVVCTRACARSIASGRSASEVLARFARWIAIVRVQRPGLLATYPLLFCAGPMLVVSALVWRRPLAQLVALLVVAARVLVALVVRWRARLPLAPVSLPWRVVASDLALLLAFLRALTARRVVWRGRSLRVTRAAKGERAREEREQRLSDAKR